MKKKLILGILIVLTMFILSGCVSGNRQEICEKTSYKILLNSASCFVYTFKDEETGVWYLSTSEGITPRLNSDGSLYIGNK